MCVEKKSIELEKKPITIGNSKGFRIRQDEIKLVYNKTYKIIIVEVD